MLIAIDFDNYKKSRRSIFIISSISILIQGLDVSSGSVNIASIEFKFEKEYFVTFSFIIIIGLVFIFTMYAINLRGTIQELLLEYSVGVVPAYLIAIGALFYKTLLLI